VIRIGHFNNFKGADTLLIDVDAAGLAWLSEVIASVGGTGQAVRLDQCSEVAVAGGVEVTVERSPQDIGLTSTGRHQFVWRRSLAGWGEVADTLKVIQNAGTPCHQYLDGPADQLPVMASMGEYGESWWNTHWT
jgi:hypothetical protein